MKKKIKGHSKSFLIHLSLIICLGLSSSCGDDETTTVPPTVVSISPGSGAEGTPVTISGINFGTSPSDIAVTFNETAATVTAATEGSITTTVPAGATTGAVKVTVGTTSAKGGLTFKVTESDMVDVTAPTITSYEPTSATVQTTITITGTNFSTTATDNVVNFNGTAATVTAATATTITATIPIGATTGAVTVTTSGKTGAGSEFVVLPTVIKRAVQLESDDAEETLGDGTRVPPTPAGTLKFDVDIEMGESESTRFGHQIVAFRFGDLAIPHGVDIESAYIQFTNFEEVDNPAPVVMYLYGEAVDSSATFTSELFNISSRPKTTARVDWDIPFWLTKDERGLDQRSADLAPIIEEIINRPGWKPGNSISIIVENSPETLLNGPETGRVPYAHDDRPDNVKYHPELIITF